MRVLTILLLAFALFYCSFHCISQEESTFNSHICSHYIDFKINKLSKYNGRLKRQQTSLLKKLKRKEDHLGSKLKRSDSVSFARFKKQSVSYDSINKISDAGNSATRIAKKKNAAIDSLRGVQTFVKDKSGNNGNITEVQNQGTQLNELQGQLNFRAYVNELIAQRTTDLKNLVSPQHSSGFKGIEKQVFYCRSRMNVFKEMQEDPTKLEEEAMEYLQGTQGFDKAIKGATVGGPGSMESVKDASQLESLGFQTKKQLQTNLQQKFGNGLNDVSKQMSTQLTEWQDRQKDLNNISETKKSLHSVKAPQKLSFKVNPMRGLPFSKRLEKQYSFQTSPAGTDGKQPAQVILSASVGFKHTPKLIYGIGVIGAAGLGQNWQNVRFTFEGVGTKVFATWNWNYGIGLYAGYEKIFKHAAFVRNRDESKEEIISSPHNTNHYSESVLIGLTKSYNMNNKYNGSIRVLYDIWWQQKGLRSPIVLQFTSTSK